MGIPSCGSPVYKLTILDCNYGIRIHKHEMSFLLHREEEEHVTAKNV